MNRYLLDTNHLSPIVTLDHALRNRILRQLNTGDRFALTTPVLFEFLFGIRSLSRAAQNMRIWEKSRQILSTIQLSQGMLNKQ